VATRSIKERELLSVLDRLELDGPVPGPWWKLWTARDEDHENGRQVVGVGEVDGVGVSGARASRLALL